MKKMLLKNGIPSPLSHARFSRKGRYPRQKRRSVLITSYSRFSPQSSPQGTPISGNLIHIQLAALAERNTDLWKNQLTASTTRKLAFQLSLIFVLFHTTRTNLEVAQTAQDAEEQAILKLEDAKTKLQLKRKIYESAKSKLEAADEIFRDKEKLDLDQKNEAMPLLRAAQKALLDRPLLKDLALYQMRLKIIKELEQDFNPQQRGYLVARRSLRSVELQVGAEVKESFEKRLAIARKKRKSENLTPEEDELDKTPITKNEKIYYKAYQDLRNAKKAYSKWQDLETLLSPGTKEGTMKEKVKKWGLAETNLLARYKRYLMAKDAVEEQKNQLEQKTDFELSKIAAELAELSKEIIRDDENIQDEQEAIMDRKVDMGSTNGGSPIDVGIDFNRYQAGEKALNQLLRTLEKVIGNFFHPGKTLTDARELIAPVLQQVQQRKLESGKLAIAFMNPFAGEMTKDEIEFPETLIAQWETLQEYPPFAAIHQALFLYLGLLFQMNRHSTKVFQSSPLPAIFNALRDNIYAAIFQFINGEITIEQLDAQGEVRRQVAADIGEVTLDEAETKELQGKIDAQRIRRALERENAERKDDDKDKKTGEALETWLRQETQRRVNHRLQPLIESKIEEKKKKRVDQQLKVALRDQFMASMTGVFKPLQDQIEAAQKLLALPAFATAWQLFVKIEQTKKKTQKQEILDKLASYQLSFNGAMEQFIAGKLTADKFQERITGVTTKITESQREKN